jgi:PBP1b-binding outer membrane lipoprotein LpoB
MRLMSLILAVMCTALVFSGCASRAPVSERAPTPAAKPASIAKHNRFDMSQNGRRMSADDFDAWMKARGIRVAKGGPRTTGQAKAPPRSLRGRSPEVP